MTTAGGTATSINAPATEGAYKMYVIDQAGNASSASTATLTVDNTGPTGGVITSLAGTLTRNKTPTLTMTEIADTGVGITGAQMQFSCDNSNWSPIENFSITKTNFIINSKKVVQGMQLCTQ
jgi:hypothetical protein